MIAFLNINTGVSDTMKTSIIELFDDEVLLQFVKHIRPIVITMQVAFESGDICNIRFHILQTIPNLISYQNIVDMDSIVRNTRFHNNNVHKRGSFFFNIQKEDVKRYLESKKTAVDTGQ